MSDVIGRGTIEVTADASKLKAGIGEARKSIKDLGKDVSGSMQEATGKAAASIDRYVKKLQTVAATNGKSARETELYGLALRGASKAQLDAADSALRLNEGYERGIAIGQRLRTGLIAVAAAASAAAVASVSHSISLLDSLDDVSEKSGISVESLSALRFAGEATGTSFESLRGGLTKLAKQMAEAAGGNKEAIATFKTLGVEVKNTDGTLRSTDAVLNDLADRFSKYEDGAGKAALAQRVFGKSGEDMIPFLNQGAVGLANLTREAKQLGAIYSGDVAKNAAEFGDNIKKIGLASEAAAISIAGPMISALARLSGQYLEAKKSGESFLPVLSALAKYATPAGQLTLAGQIATGTVFDKKTIARADVLASIRPEDSQDAVYRKFLRPPTKLPAPVVAEPKTGGGGGGRAAKDNSAEQEAKAQLAFDLDQIKNARERITNTIANSEKVLEAMRGASLQDESAYYSEKLSLLQRSQTAEIDALNAEKQRLEQEKLNGKDAIDNARKIADVEAKINKSREDAAANIEVLKIRQVDALKQIRVKFEEAEAAARSYVSSIAAQNNRDLEGMGKGNRQREIDGQIATREDQFQVRRSTLDSQRRSGQISSADYDRYLEIERNAHQQALDEDKRYWDKKLELQGNFALGAQEALKNYYDESQNVFKQTEEAVTNAFKGMEDAIVEFATGGKVSIKDLANSIIKDIARIAIKQHAYSGERDRRFRLIVTGRHAC